MHTYLTSLPSIIEEIWILTSKGIPFIHLSRIQNPDEIPIGGFLSAMREVCAQMSNTDFQTFSMADSKFISIPCCNNDVMIFSKSPNKAKDKKIVKICKAISNVAEDYIRDIDFNKWDGDISYFDDLKEQIILYFKMSNV